jgi:hypothetical protein
MKQPKATATRAYKRRMATTASSSRVQQNSNIDRETSIVRRIVKNADGSQVIEEREATHEHENMQRVAEVLKITSEIESKMSIMRGGDPRKLLEVSATMQSMTRMVYDELREFRHSHKDKLRTDWYRNPTLDNIKHALNCNQGLPLVCVSWGDIFGTHLPIEHQTLQNLIIAKVTWMAHHGGDATYDDIFKQDLHAVEIQIADVYEDAATVLFTFERFDIHELPITFKFVDAAFLRAIPNDVIGHKMLINYAVDLQQDFVSKT